ncbi:uncharacterized protein [Ptychodera flava]|uniref:uncharacterized protein n=1 Tax=Ptychodera flava TaxID=63121 RepID=UPI00396A6D5D
MASVSYPEGVLSVSTSWDETTQQVISNFCEMILHKTLNTKLPPGYCTVLDVEVSEETQNEAASYGVTLIPASRNKLVDPLEDPPGIHWLINHNNYYPGLRELNVGHVVGLSAKTKNAASVIHQSLFPEAKFHQMLSKPAALFVAHAWNNDELGLTGFHRNLVQDFCARKSKAGEDLKTYSTVLDVKISDDQRKDAESCGVTLIPARIKKKDDAKDEHPALRWLLHHEIYYPHLKDLDDIQYVVGYGPKTGHAAADIRANIFPHAKLVLINHACPETNGLDAQEHTIFEDKMLEMASKADLVFSIGPVIYEYFQNAYRATVHGKDLSDIPHEEILPKPPACFWDSNPVLRETNKHSILTCGQIDTQKAIEGCSAMASSIGSVANHLKAGHGKIKPPEWKIEHESPHADMTLVMLLTDKLQSPHVKPTLHPGHSAKPLLKSLQQSHLCLPAPCYEDYSFYGLEAMVFGLPTVVYESSHLGQFIIKHFEDYTEYAVERSPEKNMSEKILTHLQNTDQAFKKAKALKTALVNSNAISTSYGKFTSLLTHSQPVKQQTADYIEEHRKAKGDSSTDATEGRNNTPTEPDTLYTESLDVQVGFNNNVYHQRRRELEDQVKALPPQLMEQKQEMMNALNAVWEFCEQALKRKVQEVVADEDGCQEVKKLCKKKLGDVNTTSLTVKCLAMVQNFLTLYNLYRLKQTCRSGSLAKAFEPLLITDEMRKMASTVGITLQLKVSYDQERFKEIELFFINRDGGGIQPLRSRMNEDVPAEGSVAETTAVSKWKKPILFHKMFKIFQWMTLY